MTQRILVVDDDPKITRLLRASLEQAGFQVWIASNGETTLHILRRERPDLALFITLWVQRTAQPCVVPKLILYACDNGRDILFDGGDGHNIEVLNQHLGHAWREECGQRGAQADVFDV